MPRANAIEDFSARRFTRHECDALFANILIDDIVDAHTAFPARPRFEYPQAQLIDCFRLSRQLWRMDVDRTALRDLTTRIAHAPEASTADRTALKHVRARFKHLRFAFGVHAADHRYPLLLDWTTIEMGHLQDALRNRRRAPARRHAARLRLLLAPAPYGLIEREADRLRPESSAGFARYLEAQACHLARAVAQPALTGHAFHATRKIVSRLVSFYGTLQVVDPARDSFLAFRSLSAINGLMGDMHDRLVERRDAGVQDYRRDAFALPHEIARRLAETVAWYGSGPGR